MGDEYTRTEILEEMLVGKLTLGSWLEKTRASEINFGEGRGKGNYGMERGSKQCKVRKKQNEYRRKGEMEDSDGEGGSREDTKDTHRNQVTQPPLSNASPTLTLLSLSHQ